ncbi:unnamed protein product [Mesocestoides corti]|uniref:Protein kinase domain-containing protein n=1 Tax=Mesocestoides corti TaxID=53468 RepID=A0A158QU50_MESCO|nr:unnamed protein product [Mesocestoides corti]
MHAWDLTITPTAGGRTRISVNFACRSKRNGDTCASSCPQKHLVSPFTSRQEPNPDFKYELHDICVKNCPVSGGVSLGIPLSIYNAAHVEFLGFKSLRYMDMDAYLEAMPSLCYTSALEKVIPVRTRNVKDPATCIREGHVCHSECLPEAGCWGPGPSMCAHCCAFEAGGICVSKCSDVPGFYAPSQLGAALVHGSAIFNNSAAFQCRTLPLKMDKIANLNERDLLISVQPAPQCARCHEECAETCSGPEADQCIGECKHFKSGDQCVRRCSRDQYADEAAKACFPCNPVCLPPTKAGFLPEEVSSCSGPGGHLGLGGCAFCYFVQRDKATSTYICLEERCPEEHFGNATQLKYLDLTKEQLSLGNLQAANFALQECVPCDPQCEVCVGPGTHISVCRKCRNWMYRSECVTTCPPDETYMPNTTTEEAGLSEREKLMLERKECLPCHPQCSGGCTAYGPNFCKNCRYAKIVIDVQKNEFICNSTCPPEKPYIMDNTNLCLDEDQYEEISGSKAAQARNQVLLAVGLVLLFILIFSIVFAVLCFNYKAKRSRIKEALKSTYTNVKAPDMKDAKASREPNMGRWEMINIDDLTFEDPDNPIGKGAFGEVFRGKWRVPKRILNQFNLARSTSLDVAIKVIRSPTTPNNTSASVSDSSASSTGAQLNATTIERISARSNLQDMLSEAKVMASVQHKNCLPLIGVCLTRKMQCMVSVFVEAGSLDRYLRLHKDELNSFTLLSWAEQIADGMAYLEERGIIHRDLAARNVLVQSPELVQITDFGLAKMLDNSDEDSVVVRTGRVPIRWLAIETLQDGIYSHKTDVWSYGVTLWEIFTFGKQPYENVSTADIKDHVMKGVRLSQPEICTLDTYMVMVRCWMEEHESRPTFMELMKCFHKYCQTPGRYLYIEGDEYAITRNTPYTPSPAPWTELQPLPSSYRGVPDGIAGPPNGTPFGFSENQFFDDQRCSRQRLFACQDTSEGNENAETQSLLPHRIGYDHHHHHSTSSHPRRMFFHSNESRMGYNGVSTLGSQSTATGRYGRERPVNVNSPTISTNLDTWPTADGTSSAGICATPDIQRQSTSPNYYNASAFLASGAYGPMIRPPPPPPPIAEAEHVDDVELDATGDVSYLPTLDRPVGPKSADVSGGMRSSGSTKPPIDQEDYLEPRTSGDGGRPSSGSMAVENPGYFSNRQEYLEPSAERDSTSHPTS